MKNLDKIDEGATAPVNKNDSKKDITKAKDSGALIDSTVESKETKIVLDVVGANEAKPMSKKDAKAEAKIAVVKSPQKAKTETEPMIQNVVVFDSKEEQEKPDSDKKKIKVVKKKAKKAEEKVVKLKKEVKKAKKKEVKKSKLKGLKEKLEKALDKLKSKVKKLKNIKNN